MEFVLPVMSYECLSLKVVVESKFGSCLELEFCGERSCRSVSEILFKQFPRRHVFCCWENSCCSCIIPEVPVSRIVVQPALKALERSEKA